MLWGLYSQIKILPSWWNPPCKMLLVETNIEGIPEMKSWWETEVHEQWQETIEKGKKEHLQELGFSTFYPIRSNPITSLSTVTPSFTPFRRSSFSDTQNKRREGDNLQKIGRRCRQINRPVRPIVGRSVHQVHTVSFISWETSVHFGSLGILALKFSFLDDSVRLGLKYWRSFGYWPCMQEVGVQRWE
jgi:hypothetical protein